MKPEQTNPANTSSKMATGIVGFDKITGGGLPRKRTTLLMGGSGAGKTVMALQFLVHGARHCKEPGIFVAFEETSQRIVANAASFGWKMETLMPNRPLAWSSRAIFTWAACWRRWPSRPKPCRRSALCSMPWTW